VDASTNAFLILEEKLSVQELAVFDYTILLLFRVQNSVYTIAPFMDATTNAFIIHD